MTTEYEIKPQWPDLFDITKITKTTYRVYTGEKFNCECKAFKKKRKCKHIKMCGWMQDGK